MITLSRKKALQIVQAAQEKGKKADLSGADLSLTDLSGVDLSGVYFIEANLRGADLNRAYLAGANLSQADLSGTHLRGANLGGANLNKANLGQANLDGTDLSMANLNGVYFNRANLSRANLSGADLSGAYLSGADLSGANLNQTDIILADLSQANLSGADLSQADLSEADLNRANLSGANLNQVNLFRANLSQANLSQADLSWADLSGTDLSGANLSQAYFNRTKLSRADFSRAIVGLTSFGDIALNEVKGLDCVEHHGPSTIGLDTLCRSRGQINGVFLRGCGLSDVQIETAKLNNPDLTTSQITTITHRIHELLVEQTDRSCFISYASKDEVFAQQLHDDLQQKGIRCWFAPEALKIGDDKTRSTIDYSIRLHDKLLLILSERSINSDWVAKEVETAFNEENRRGQTVLYPIRLDETVLETDQAWATDIRRTRHIGDFSRWQDHETYQQALVQLLRDLAIREERPVPWEE